MRCCYCECEIHPDAGRVTMGELVAHEHMSTCADLLRKRLAQAVAAERARWAGECRKLAQMYGRNGDLLGTAKALACDTCAAVIERGEG